MPGTRGRQTSATLLSENSRASQLANLITGNQAVSARSREASACKQSPPRILKGPRPSECIKCKRRAPNMSATASATLHWVSMERLPTASADKVWECPQNCALRRLASGTSHIRISQSVFPSPQSRFHLEHSIFPDLWCILNISRSITIHFMFMNMNINMVNTGLRGRVLSPMVEARWCTPPIPATQAPLATPSKKK